MNHGPQVEPRRVHAAQEVDVRARRRDEVGAEELLRLRLPPPARLLWGVVFGLWSLDLVFGI